MMDTRILTGSLSYFTIFLLVKIQVPIPLLCETKNNFNVKNAVKVTF